MIFSYNSFIQKIFLVAVLFSAGIFSACQTVKPAAETDDAADENAASFDIPPSDINLAKPLVVSQKPEDVALAKKIDDIIEQSEFANSRWGVFAVSLKDGRIVVARDARQLFNPASIEKAMTSIVALDKLGADFRFKTSIFAPGQIDANGTLNGDLIIYGTGAPDFNDAALDNLISQLQAKGLRHITGNIVGDDSYFKGANIGDGWTWNDLQWHYGAEASALSFKENQAAVFMNSDGKPAVSNDLMGIEGELQPAQSGHTEAFGIQRGLEDNEIYVWGNGNKAYGRISVHNPALWVAKTLKESLAQKGITIDGDFRAVGWKTANRADVAGAAELAAVESKTLGELIQRMNKHSVNLYGELLLRTLGKKFGDTAPDESRQLQELRGDDAAGAAVIKKFLKENNVAVEDIQIRDGSGLSRLDFVSPEAFGRALIYAAQSNFAEIFKDSLPIAATDGTLGGRLGKVKGEILAKTGSITFVNSLAGYAQVAPDEVYAFAIISNNVTRKSDSARLVDAIATSLIKRSKDQTDDNANVTNNKK